MTSENTTPYQRLVQEQQELGDRIIKLTTFIFQGAIYKSLDEYSKYLLRVQLNIMQGYYRILTQRVEIFKEV